MAHIAAVDLCDGKNNSCHDSLEPDLELSQMCSELYAEATKRLVNDGETFCPADMNIASCWPPVSAGSFALVPCLKELNGISYVYTTNATASRECYANGSWSSFNNYSDCIDHRLAVDTGAELDGNQLANALNLLTTILHYCGYSLSTASCLLALLIYLRFRSLCSLRNVIHLNLIMTYVLSAIAWVVMTLHMDDLPVDPNQADVVTVVPPVLRGMIIAFTYCDMTTFFWALCEGIFMTCILFRPHKLEQLTYWPFAVLGWVVPVIITSTWAVVKIFFDDHADWLKVLSGYNYIFIAPILTVLAINLVLLITALHTILQKISRRPSSTRNSRNSTNATASSQVGRGVRSFLILMPLLGLTYLLVIVQPSERGTTRTVFQLITAVLVSSQGFFVSVMYCFCNRQVRGILKFHCHRKLSALGCYETSRQREGDHLEADLSSFTRNLDVRNFRGNSNEYQYLLNVKKALRRNGPPMDAESIRLSRMNSKNQIPVVMV
ncbi:hypothetical protein RvY_16305 [Ramazzottius varieornatus]|uniref:G-protein coupled receptors family 2 profile 2 domain-containing protein n=1 Tax=Ramazzottius varieornatus TaxID=947166 RepID=A0A1D1VYY1_RAMVA|nr:hypothetical protein RvY_16305 [Ramazzottius varieornatus]